MKMVDLGDLVSIKGGGTPNKGISSYWGGCIPWASVKDFKSLEISETVDSITEEGVKKSATNIIPAGTVITPTRMAVGKAAINTIDLAINQDLKALLPKKNVDSRFLLHVILANSHNLEKQASGATVKGIKLDALRELKVPSLSYEEQKRISAILDQADSLRRARRQAIEKLNSLSQSIFYGMFGDPVKNEREWDVKKLKTLSTKISSGSTPVGGKQVYVEDGTVFLRSQNVWRNRIELDDVVYIDKATHQKMKKTSLKHGDILITKTGRINTENSSLGRAAMYLGENDSANINGHVYLIRPKSDVLKEFVLYIMTTPEYREYIRSVCVGGIDKRQINKEHLEEFPIIYPPIEEQKKFLKCLAVIEEQKARFCEQSKLTENLFLSLQQRAFRGEL